MNIRFDSLKTRQTGKVELGEGVRKIKFRAWDTVAKKMIQDVGILPFKGSDTYKSEGDSFLMVGKKNTRFVLMQFTTLLDRNDREIYEGDIVRMGNVFGAVEWHKGMWVIIITNPIPEMEHGITALSPNSHKNTEVIGNIYEIQGT